MKILQFFKHFGLKGPPQIFQKIGTFCGGRFAAAAERFGALRAKGRGVLAAAEECLHRLRTAERRGRLVRRAAALAAMAAVTVGSILTGMAAVKTATVTVDGVQKYSSQVFSTDTAAILKTAGVVPGPDSLLSRREGDGRVVLSIRTACRVTVAADGKEQRVLLHTGDTAADALEKAGVAPGPDDRVSPQAGEPVRDGGRVEVQRGMHVAVLADGKAKDAVVYGGTVAEALNGAGVKVDSDDIVSPDGNTAVRDGMKISVSRVEYQDVKSVQPVPYSTVTVKDASLAAGKTAERKAGQNGEKTVVTRRKFVDGKAAESAVVSSDVTRQPVNREVAVGTKKAARAARARRYGAAVTSASARGTLVDHNGRTVSYRKLLQGRCSAYTGGGTTSTGRAAAFGLVAVNPNIIPYGSRLYICSPDGRLVYGYAVAADTGGAAMRNIIIADLYYDTYSQCARIGTRTMNVYVL